MHEPDIHVDEFHDITPERFAREIQPRAEPAVLRGAIAHWPAVAAGRAGRARAMGYLAALSNDEPVTAIVGEPGIEGRLHHAEDLREPNFERRRMTLKELLSSLEAEVPMSPPRVLAVQGLPLSQYLPLFSSENPMALLPDAAGRAWIGNAAKVATHNDPAQNIACCVVGRRRFTLFPPEQIGNLYLGPFHLTPAGTQVSMVHVTKPDLARYPRFERALQAARVAELEPGDAVYLPYQWFHHVEALDTFNVLVNYWWNRVPAGVSGSPYDAFMHGLMSLRGLSPAQRRAWRAAFDHYVFLVDGDPGAHLPAYARGILGADSPQDLEEMRRQILQALSSGGRKN
jgi:hypothetical protein